MRNSDGKKRCTEWGSNPRPWAYEPSALSIEPISTMQRYIRATYSSCMLIAQMDTIVSCRCRCLGCLIGVSFNYLYDRICVANATHITPQINEWCRICVTIHNHYNYQAFSQGNSEAPLDCIGICHIIPFTQ